MVSSSSAVQALVLLVAVTTQSNAFHPTISRRGISNINGFRKINSQAPIASNGRNHDRLFMNIDGEKDKGLSPLKAGTASLDIPQEPASNPISKWV
jgi:hypothetical protein